MIGRPRSVGIREWWMSALVTLGASLAGCGEGDFVPPPPPPSEARGPAVPGDRTGAPADTIAPANSFASGPTVRRIDYILSLRTDPDQLLLEATIARKQAGHERARIHIKPDETIGNPGTAASPATSQAALVRSSIAERPLAIIVAPDDPTDSELARAVGEARAAKIPVVLVGRLVTDVRSTQANAAPIVVVAPHGFAESAQKIVELSIRNLKTAEADPKGGAILLVSTSSDRLIGERLAAIRDALAAAKIPIVEEIRVTSKFESSVDGLLKRLEANPKADLVIFLDTNGSLVSTKVATDLADRCPFVQAGYAADETRIRMVQFGEFAAICTFDPSRMIKKAVSVAAAIAQGRPAKETEEISVNVLESPDGSGKPHLQSKRKSQINHGESEKPAG